MVKTTLEIYRTPAGPVDRYIRILCFCSITNKYSLLYADFGLNWKDYLKLARDVKEHLLRAKDG